MNKYTIIEEIAKGSFGQVYKGQNRLTKEYVAIKKSLCNNNNLKFEAKLYQYINRFVVKGFPKLKWFENKGEYNYLVTELLGRPLSNLIGLISFENALNIGVQLIERIQTLHSLGLIHRDVKPDNFLFGLNNNNSLLYLIDLGIAKKYIDDDTGLHITPYKLRNNNTTHSIIGTPKYMSVNIHEQLSEPSRRDDIESCLYIILELIWGKLIWDTNDLQKMTQIKKQFIKLEWKGSENSSFLIDLLVYTRSLSFEEEPNYKYIIETLSQIDVCI
uniref:non-specific serine/threonine protein kinase n=1 Tax=viral metagenome TaxID=1070528 RepID=A0A6C0ITB9_9ZZZZ